MGGEREKERKWKREGGRDRYTHAQHDIPFARLKPSATSPGAEAITRDASILTQVAPDRETDRAVGELRSPMRLALKADAEAMAPRSRMVRCMSFLRPGRELRITYIFGSGRELKITEKK